MGCGIPIPGTASAMWTLIVNPEVRDTFYKRSPHPD